jgi:predicted dehydrogenase
VALQTVKIGLVGAGKMGILHLTKLLKLPQVECVGVYEPNFEKAQELTNKFNVKTFTSFEELLFFSEAVIIASPTPTHFGLAKTCLESGCHVLIEKPLCETVEEALTLDLLALQKGLICQVGFLERYRFHALMAGQTIPDRAYLESQRLSVVVGREPSVDVISDLMVHDIDLILSLVKEEPVQITAEGFCVVTEYLDYARAKLEFSGGRIALLTASRVAPKMVRGFKAISSNYFCELDFIINTKFLASSHADEKRETEPISFDALEKQALSFVSSIQSRSTPMITAQQGAKVIQVSKAIRETITNRKVSHFTPRRLDASLPIRGH